MAHLFHDIADIQASLRTNFSRLERKEERFSSTLARSRRRFATQIWENLEHQRREEKGRFQIRPGQKFRKSVGREDATHIEFDYEGLFPDTYTRKLEYVSLKHFGLDGEDEQHFVTAFKSSKVREEEEEARRERKRREELQDTKNQLQSFLFAMNALSVWVHVGQSRDPDDKIRNDLKELVGEAEIVPWKSEEFTRMAEKKYEKAVVGRNILEPDTPEESVKPPPLDLSSVIGQDKAQKNVPMSRQTTDRDASDSISGSDRLSTGRTPMASPHTRREFAQRTRPRSAAAVRDQQVLSARRVTRTDSSLLEMLGEDIGSSRRHSPPQDTEGEREARKVLPARPSSAQPHLRHEEVPPSPSTPIKPLSRSNSRSPLKERPMASSGNPMAHLRKQPTAAWATAMEEKSADGSRKAKQLGALDEAFSKAVANRPPTPTDNAPNRLSRSGSCLSGSETLTPGARLLGSTRRTGGGFTLPSSHRPGTGRRSVVKSLGSAARLTGGSGRNTAKVHVHRGEVEKTEIKLTGMTLLEAGSVVGGGDTQRSMSSKGSDKSSGGRPKKSKGDSKSGKTKGKAKSKGSKSKGVRSASRSPGPSPRRQHNLLQLEEVVELGVTPRILADSVRVQSTDVTPINSPKGNYLEEPYSLSSSTLSPAITPEMARAKYSVTPPSPMKDEDISLVTGPPGALSGK